MRALGLDLGTRRVGVALSDSGGSVATPLTTIDRGRKRHRDELLRELLALVEAYDVEIVVVGMPRSLDGTDGPAAKRAAEEIAAIGVNLPVPVESYDERLTTLIAEQSLRDLGVRAKDQRKAVDQLAAAEILQSWLDHGRATEGDDPQ
jgi:putative Holliday junction resolvase